MNRHHAPERWQALRYGIMIVMIMITRVLRWQCVCDSDYEYALGSRVWHSQQCHGIEENLGLGHPLQHSMLPSTTRKTAVLGGEETIYCQHQKLSGLT